MPALSYRIMRSRLLTLLAIVSITQISFAEKRTVVCKTPAIAASCYSAHGRLSVWNGAVNWRLWKIGTSNLLGIYSGPSTFKDRYDNLDSEAPQLPANLAKAFPAMVYADFEVCPLDPTSPATCRPPASKARPTSSSRRISDCY